MTCTKKDLVTAVRKYAQENYTTGAWYFVESCQDSDILDVIGAASTVQDAIENCSVAVGGAS